MKRFASGNAVCETKHDDKSTNGTDDIIHIDDVQLSKPKSLLPISQSLDLASKTDKDIVLRKGIVLRSSRRALGKVMVEVQFRTLTQSEGNDLFTCWLRVEDLSVGTSEYKVHVCDRAAQASAKVDAATSNFLKKRCKACPNCGKMIEKNAGCNDM